MKNAFAELTSRLDTNEKRISKLEDFLIESSKTQKQRKKMENNRTEYPRTVGQLTCVIYA